MVSFLVDKALGRNIGYNTTESMYHVAAGDKPAKGSLFIFTTDHYMKRMLVYLFTKLVAPVRRRVVHRKVQCHILRLFSITNMRSF